MRDELAILWRAAATRCVLLRDEGQWELRVVTAELVERSQLFTTAQLAHEAALRWRDEASERQTRLTARPTFW